jgi:hypothetical protein
MLYSAAVAASKTIVKPISYIFFQDIADADNFKSIAAFIKLYGAPTPINPIHFVLTLRPEDFCKPKFFPGCGFPFPGVVPKDSDRTCDTDDTLYVGHDAVRRLVTLLSRYLHVSLQEAFMFIRVYNGGCPTLSSNLNHAIHARDYLSDRKDLITGSPVDIGQLINGIEYMNLQRKLNDAIHPMKSNEIEQNPKDISLDRQILIRSLITDGLDHFTQATGCVCQLRPLSDLLVWLANDMQPIIAFLLAPLTGLSNLFKLDTCGILYSRLVKIFGQLFAWDNCAPKYWSKSPLAKNILLNQFNVDCDTDAVKHVLDELCKCIALLGIFLVPTEILKADELLSLHEQLHETLKTKDFNHLRVLEGLWHQWNLIKGKAQIIFDPAVIFLASEVIDMEMKPVTIIIHDGIEFNWDRSVFRMIEDEKHKLPIFAAWDFVDQKAYWSEMINLLN